MARMSEERRKKYQEFNDNFDMIASYPEFVQQFLARAAKSRVNMVSMQNLSWMGFFRSPFSQDFDNSDIVIVGAGTDYGTLSETADMRHAPMYLRTESKNLIPYIGDEYNMAPFDQARIIDMGDVDLFGLNYGQQLDHIGGWLKRAAEADNLILMFGGEHSTAHGSHGALEVTINRHFDGTPAGGIIFDGHCDMFPEQSMDGITDEPRENANFLVAAMAKGLIDPERFVCMGIRENGGGFSSGWEISQELGITVVSPRMVAQKGATYWREFVAERVSGGPTIIECDLDGLDPVMSGGGVSTRDGFGLSWREYQEISRAFINNNLIYANIVEYAPGRDPNRLCATNATHLGFEYLCMLTQTKVKLNGGKHKQTEWPNAMGTSVGYFGGE